MGVPASFLCVTCALALRISRQPIHECMGTCVCGREQGEERENKLEFTQVIFKYQFVCGCGIMSVPTIARCSSWGSLFS